MKRTNWTYLIVGSALMLSPTAAPAQEAAPEPPPPPMMMLTQAGMPEEGPGPGGFGERIELLGFEGMHPGKIVKGAPFSANATSETTQTLQDGTVIHRTTKSTLYRDGEGRSRREVTFSGFGPLDAAGKTHTMIMINDSVAGAHYVLNPQEKVAHKMTARSGNGGAPGGKDFHERLHQHFAKEAAAETVNKESLGTQNINGVIAEGTRVTHTISAGQIGNDKPILIVFERWYSPDLQMVVKSTRSDPRFGTTTYALTNVQRTEPAAALFTVPADYTVKEGGPGRLHNHMRGFHGAPPAGAPADAPPPPPGS